MSKKDFGVFHLPTLIFVELTLSYGLFPLCLQDGSQNIQILHGASSMSRERWDLFQELFLFLGLNPIRFHPTHSIGTMLNHLHWLNLMINSFSLHITWPIYIWSCPFHKTLSLLDFCSFLVLFLFSGHYFLLSAGFSSYPQPAQHGFSPKA